MSQQLLLSTEIDLYLLDVLASTLETVEHIVMIDDDAVRNARVVSVMTIKLTETIAKNEMSKNKKIFGKLKL